MEILDLTHKYIIARWMYSIQEPIISDENYNALHRYILDNESEFPSLHQYVTRSWSSDPCPVELLGQYDMLQYARNIRLFDKTESISSLRDDYEYIEYLNSLDRGEEVTLSHKLDGFNCQVHYWEGVPFKCNGRGRSMDEKDMSSVLPLMPQQINIMGYVRVVGELHIPNSLFEEVKAKLNVTDQTAAVSSCIANNPSYLVFKAFEYSSKDYIEDDFLARIETLRDNGFDTVDVYCAVGAGEIDRIVQELSDQRDIADYPSDGVVLKGRYTNRIIAIRVKAWQEDTLVGKITGFIEEQGPSYMGLKATIEPVKVLGKTISKVNVYNWNKVIYDLDVCVGDYITFTMRSDTIPTLTGRL